MESEDGLATRQIAAALAFLVQRERPLQPGGSEEIAVSPQPTFQADAAGKRESRGMAPQPKFAAGAPLMRYRIEVGRKQGVLPKEIVGAIANEGGIDGKLIGQINLFDDYSTVELPELPADILAMLKRTWIRQQPLRIRPAAEGERGRGLRKKTASRPARRKAD